MGFELWLSDKRVDFLRWLTLQPNTSINIYGFRLPLTYRLSDVEEADFDFPRLSSWNISDTLLSLCCLSISILSTFDLSLSNSSSCSSHLFSSCRALDCAANCAIVKYKAKLKLSHETKGDIKLLVGQNSITTNRYLNFWQLMYRGITTYWTMSRQLLALMLHHQWHKLNWFTSLIPPSPSDAINHKHNDYVKPACVNHFCKEYGLCIWKENNKSSLNAPTLNMLEWVEP